MRSCARRTSSLYENSHRPQLRDEQVGAQRRELGYLLIERGIDVATPGRMNARQPRRDVAALLRRAYTEFNARNIDAALATTQGGVDWPNMLDGVRLHGHTAVRQYWARQFATFDPHVEPIAMSEDDEERVIVRVHQVLKSLDGKVLSDSEVTHVYTLRDGLIARMDVLPAARP